MDILPAVSVCLHRGGFFVVHSLFVRPVSSGGVTPSCRR